MKTYGGGAEAVGLPDKGKSTAFEVNLALGHELLPSRAPSVRRRKMARIVLKPTLFPAQTESFTVIWRKIVSPISVHE
jgi:hypothetical protein